MSLPSQDVLDDIKELITEITGFKESNENFAICERYCLSHVVHHMYPSVTKTAVKNLVQSYVSRFYGHGYFKISQELNHQVKRFLSNEKLFEKNPQYDIQWSLLSLLCSLSSNLNVVKEVPELLPIEDEENEAEDFNWSEYLMKDLPQHYHCILSSDSEDLSQDDIEENKETYSEISVTSQNETEDEKLCQTKKMTVINDNNMVFNDEMASELRRKKFEEFLRSRQSNFNIENDYQLRGNISEKFNALMNQEGIIRRSQLKSEFEMMENILYQFQTGERILLKKGLVNPTLTSLTQDTLCNYLEYLQPYFKIIRRFKDFDAEITEAKYPDKDGNSMELNLKGNSSLITSSKERRKVPNVLYIYSIMLRKALEPFENEVMDIVGNLEHYTLIKMEQKLRAHFFDLTSLSYVHSLATKNWKKDCNWMSSIRVLLVLYTAIMNATTAKMSFLYLNLFLQCFRVYLDIIDNSISFLDLIDPNEEFIVVKSGKTESSENNCSEFEIRPYKTELKSLGIKEVPILDLIAEKMIQVGQSLEVLKRLNRFVTHDGDPKESSYQALIKSINAKIDTFGKIAPTKTDKKPQEKKRSIFTMGNSSLLLEKDDGGGDCSRIKNLLDEVKEEKEEVQQNASSCSRTDPSCRNFIYSTIRNPFFKMAFDEVGVEHVYKKLEEAKLKEKEGDYDVLMVVKEREEAKSVVYPFHKLISEAFQQIFGSRISNACTLVKDIVLNECELSSHLSLLRSVLLFNDAYLIQPFILALFTQPVIWESPFSLTLHLKECIGSIYKKQANALSVTLSKNKIDKFENILQVIDAINVDYEVLWPLTFILTPEVMEKYNKIFRLALKLKWAHWTLSGLRFQKENEDQSSMSKHTQHRLHVLRFWFLSVLSRINNYFMGQMLAWNVDLNSCKDFKEIIRAHSDFIERIYFNCLLDDKNSEEKDLIFETLIPLCMTLRVEGSVMEEKKLSSVENVFGRCQHNLSKLMASLEK